MGANIAENIHGIKAKIANLRPQAELIAVSKGHDVEKIREAINAGQKLFGENRVQEAATKFPQLKNEFPELKLHLIGPLQTNKIKDVLKLFDVIQTVDREKLAKELAKNISPQNITKEFFIQVNIGEEEQKAGVAPKSTAEFYKFCTQDLKLNITGLMCIPPLNEPAFMYFALLKNIALNIDCAPSVATAPPMAHRRMRRADGSPLLKLSMGMSADFEDALELGADYVRIGTAIFGERKP